ncbi:MAG: hypothetical protein GY794_23405 [bacterium]|nr:hypothetical protein [bacterium]
MLFKKISGYILTIVSGLILLAGVVFLALQWDNKTEYSLYGKNINDAITGVVIVCSMLAGWLTPKVFRVMLIGIAKIRTVRKEQEKLRSVQSSVLPDSPGRDKNLQKKSLDSGVDPSNSG